MLERRELERAGDEESARADQPRPVSKPRRRLDPEVDQPVGGTERVADRNPGAQEAGDDEGLEPAARRLSAPRRATARRSAVAVGSIVATIISAHPVRNSASAPAWPAADAGW